MSAKAVVLLAEDEPTDVYFVQWAFKEAGLPHQVFTAADGQEAVDYLSGEGPFTDRQKYPLPDLLLLDLKMPRLTGFDVLQWLQERPQFQDLTVLVLTSSDYPGDVARARELGADDYRVKPSNPFELVKLVRELDAKWLRASAPVEQKI